MELLKTLLSPEQIQMLMDIAVAAGVVLASACKLIGALSLLVAALKKLLVVVKRWAAHTATKRDDGVAEALSIGLDASAAGLEWAKHWLELAALNKGWNEQVVEVKPVSK